MWCCLSAYKLFTLQLAGYLTACYWSGSHLNSRLREYWFLGALWLIDTSRHRARCMKYGTRQDPGVLLSKPLRKALAQASKANVTATFINISSQIPHVDIYGEKMQDLHVFPYRDGELSVNWGINKHVVTSLSSKRFSTMTPHNKIHQNKIAQHTEKNQSEMWVTIKGEREKQHNFCRARPKKITPFNRNCMSQGISFTCSIPVDVSCPLTLFFLSLRYTRSLLQVYWVYINLHRGVLGPADDCCHFRRRGREAVSREAALTQGL